MATRKLVVELVGDDRSLSRTLGKSEKRLGQFGKHAVRAGAVLAAGLGAGAVKVAKDLARIEEINAQTRAGIKSTGGVANVSAKQIEALAGRLERMTSVEAESIQQGQNLLLTFKGIRNEAGRGNKIFDETSKAMVDMSVRMGTDATSAAKMLGKALNDPANGLGRLMRAGVDFTEKQKEQITALQESGDMLGAQKIMLRELEAQFGGSGRALGRTFTGQLRIAGHELGAMGEQALKFAMPALKSVTSAAGGFLRQMQSGKGAGGAFVNAVQDAFGRAKDVVGTVTKAIRGFLDRNRESIRDLGRAFTNIGKGIAFVAEKVVWPVMRRVWPGVVQIVQGAVRTIGGIIKVFTGVFTGDFRKAWEGVKQIFSGALKAVGGIVRAGTAPIRDVVARIGDVIKNVFVGAFKKVKDVVGAALSPVREFVKLLGKLAGIAKTLGGAAGDVARFVNPFGDGPGLDVKGLGGLGLGFQGAMQFKNMAGMFGLGVSSGYRPGSITSSGNLSYHAMGTPEDPRAVDYAGSGAGMLAFARLLAAKFGSRLKELIFTPLSFSIKDGRRVPAYAQAQHLDHVHVAMQRGGGIDVPGRGTGDKIPLRALLEPGERVFVLNRNATSALKQLEGLNDAVPRFQRGGMVASAARSAGFKGELLRTMVAIAKGESGWNPGAVGDGGQSIGLWQIYQPAHPWSRGLNLRDPRVNAAAAMRVYRSQGLGAWTVYNTGAYRPYLDDAARAIGAAGRGDGGGGLTARERRERTATRGRTTTREIVEGRQDIRHESRWGALEGIRDDDVVTGRERGRADRAYRARQKRLNERIARKRKRLRKVNKALRGELTKPTRDRLLGEKWQLTQDIGGLIGESKGLTGEFQDMVAPFDVDVGADVGGTVGPDTSQADLVQAVRELKESIDRQNQFAESVAGIAQKTAIKALSDVISGQIGGQVGQRDRSAGDGVTAARY